MEIKKNGKVDFCDFAGPSAFVVDLLLKNDVSRGPKTQKAQKVAYLR